MKKQGKKLLGLLVGIGVAASVLVGFVCANRSMMQQEQKQEVTSGGTFVFPNNYKKDKQFLIAEIVPDLSYAQLGYWVAGSEPYNPFEACYNGEQEKITDLVGSDSVSKKKNISQNEYTQLCYYYGEELVNNYVTGPSISGGTKQYTFYHASKEEKDGKEFQFLENKNVLAERLKPLLQEKGVDEVNVITLTTEQLNQCDITDLGNFLNDMDLVVCQQTYMEKDTQNMLVGQYGNENAPEVSAAEETFLSKDLNWDIVQKIFQLASKKKNPLPLVMDASIYNGALDDASAKEVSTYQYLLDRSVKYEKNESVDDYPLMGSGGLFQKTEYQAGKAKASSNNGYKLFLMSMFRDPVEFDNLFLESGLIQASEDGTSASYQLQSDEGTYWNTRSFLPCKGDLPGDDSQEAADEEYWTKKMAIALQLKHNNYVNCNILSYDFTVENMTDALNQNLSYGFQGSENTEEKNLCEILQSISSYQPKACIDGKQYTVLDIEPSSSTKRYSLKAEDIERMIPYTGYSKSSTLALNISRVSTAEFIGRSEDLVSTYDMIYIGNDITGMHTDGGEVVYGGKTGLNSSLSDNSNTQMKGVIYAHVGGAVQFEYDDKTGVGLESQSAVGKTNGYALYAKSGDDRGRASSGKLHYSGNDLTGLKKKQLISYIDSGLPVVVASGLTADAASSKPKYFNDIEYNNMRNLLKEKKDSLMSLDFNYRTASKASADSHLSKLTVNKPQLTLKAISYTEASSGGTKTLTGNELNGNVEYNFLSTSPDRKVTFTYTIEDVDYPGADYTCNFYIDKNADGTFAEDEKISGISSTVAAGSGEHSCTVKLNTNYTGAFTWQLVLEAGRNSAISCKLNGYGTIRFGDAVKKRSVDVLQVQAANKAHATSWGVEKARNVNLASESSGFPQLFKGLKDYDIKVTVVSLDTFSGYSLSKMKNYDMLIFGFADSYRDLDMNKECAKNVEDYILDGRSVLFTHDLTSQINNTDANWESNAAGNGTSAFMETTSGRYFNKYLRDAMGLNRFGQNVRAGSTEFCTYDKTSTGETYGFTYTTLMQYSNFRHAWNGGSKSDYYGPYKNLYVNFNTSNVGWPDIDKGYATHYVSSVNEGQITQYPFQLESSCEEDEKKTCIGVDGTSETRYKIATTHGQYYTLNLESEDVKCWFTLSDGNRSSDGTKWTNDGWYSSSQKDVANNYYIYNKGNVTYSGVGHSSSGQMTTFEKKLFVNTMVAALRAGIEGPVVHIDNGYNLPENGEDRYVVYSDVDADATDDEFNKKEDVLFHVTDDSEDGDEATDMYITLEVYDYATQKYVDVTDKTGEYAIKDRNGNDVSLTTIDYKGSELNVRKVQRSVASADATKTYNYTLKYPRGILKDKGYQNFKITVYNKEKATSYQYGAIMRLELFPLD